MRIKRALLRPVAFLAGRQAGRQFRTFLQAHRCTRRVQERLLAELVARHARTGFGRDHRFESIGSLEAFRAAVPIGSYETLRPYIQRVVDGETTALLPADESVLMFSQTSGTTGEPKLIPVTRRFLAEMRRGWNIWGIAALRDHPAAWLRPVLQISSPMQERLTARGVPCGAISGLLARTQKPIVRRMYTSPPSARAIADPVAKCYTLLRCGVGRDVAFITTANPSSTIRLIETGQTHAERLIRDVADGTCNPPGQAAGGMASMPRFGPNRALARRMEQALARDGRLLPRHFWQVSFLANWTGGTLKLYLPRLRELFDDAPIRDIGLLASEGRFSVPLQDGSSAGVAEITGNFLEFIPADQREADKPQALLADQVEVGEEYFLVVTNWAGLWRYNIDDRVRVVDRLGDSPVLEFLCRGLHTASITGEKITEHQVVEAMRRASAQRARRIDRFQLQGQFAATPYYELRLEARDGLDAGALAEALDRELAGLNVEYASKRRSGRLGPIRPVLLRPGTLEQAETENIRRRGGRSEQYKHQYLLTDVLDEAAKAQRSEHG